MNIEMRMTQYNRHFTESNSTDGIGEKYNFIDFHISRFGWRSMPASNLIPICIPIAN